MFDEEEPIKKLKPLDLDDLSVEEIEELIDKHKLEIVNLEELLKKKKDKLFESETMKNLFSTFDCRVLNIEKDQ